MIPVTGPRDPDVLSRQGRRWRRQRAVRIYRARRSTPSVASASYMTGSHAFKVGMSDTWSRTDSSTESNIHGLCLPLHQRHQRRARPVHDVRGSRSRAASLVKSELGIYGQDRWTFDRYTVNLGVRYDHFQRRLSRSVPRAGAVPAEPELFVGGGHHHEPARHHAAHGRVVRSLRQRQDGRQGHVGQVRARASSPSAIRLGVTNTATQDVDRRGPGFRGRLRTAEHGGAEPGTLTGNVANPAYNPAIDSCGAGPANFGTAHFGGAVRRGHALRLGQPALQLGVLDERAA